MNKGTGTMQNLYWKTNKESRVLVESAFPLESDLEKYIFSNQDLLDDVSIIYRQIKTGTKQGIPDMLGVDQDNRVCIIELKNQAVDQDVLPQVLRYAIWAETNPDSIRAIWLESKNKPEDMNIDWDNLDIRIIVVAPEFKVDVPRMAVKIGYPIDLCQIKRYTFEEHEFISVDFLDKPEPKRVTTTKPLIDWDWAYYESEHGQDATKQFKRMVEIIEGFVNRNRWLAPYNINKNYTGFKIANKVIFSVAWNSTYAWSVRMKIPKNSAEGFTGKDWDFQTYSTTFREAYFCPKNPDTVKIDELEPLLIEAYKRIASK